MSVTVAEEPIDRLAATAAIPIAFRVESVFDVDLAEQGLGGVRLIEHSIAVPWTKDYDRDSGEGPADWPGRFDVANWGLITARREGDRIGSAVIAWSTRDLDMLRGRADLAVLWDLRVQPDARRQGIASALIDAAVEWAAHRGCRWLAVETQNINVPACRLYVRHGFELGSIDRFAYPDLPAETQLVWFRRLDGRGP